jgi:hypothetical protein
LHCISFDLRPHLDGGRRGSLRRALTFNFLVSSHKLGLTLLPTSAIFASRSVRKSASSALKADTTLRPDLAPTAAIDFYLDPANRWSRSQVVILKTTKQLA